MAAVIVDVGSSNCLVVEADSEGSLLTDLEEKNKIDAIKFAKTSNSTFLSSGTISQTPENKVLAINGVVSSNLIDGLQVPKREPDYQNKTQSLNVAELNESIIPSYNGKWRLGKRGRPPKIKEYLLKNKWPQSSEIQEKGTTNLHNTVEHNASVQEKISKSRTKSHKSKHISLKCSAIHEKENQIILNESDDKKELPVPCVNGHLDDCAAITKLDSFQDNDVNLSNHPLDATFNSLSVSDYNNCQISKNSSPKVMSDVLRTENIGDSFTQSPSSSPEDQPRSRYGRLRKKRELSPDMESIPLVRKRSLKGDTPKMRHSLENSHTISILETFPKPKESSNENSFDNGLVENGNFEANSFLVKKDDSPLIQHQEFPVEQKNSPLSPHVVENSSISSQSVHPIEYLDNNVTKQRHLSITAEDEKEVPAEWIIGDLLWSKISGHPWWPCMVSFDPIQGIYTKVVRVRTLARVYHVQYFGHEAQHGWTVPSCVMAYEGKDKFEEHVKNFIASVHKKNTKNRNKLLAKFKITPARKKAWELAVEEAEDALKMSRAERKQELTFQYVMPKPKKNSVDIDECKLENSHVTKNGKAKTHSNKCSPKEKLKQKTPKEGPAKKNKKVCSSKIQGRTAAEDRKAEKKQKHIKQTSSKAHERGNFFVFCKKHLHEKQLQHPDLTSSALEDLLKQEWALMTDIQKARYKSRFTLGKLNNGHISGDNKMKIQGIKNFKLNKKLNNLKKIKGSTSKTAYRIHDAKIQGTVESIVSHGKITEKDMEVERKESESNGNTVTQELGDGEQTIATIARQERVCQICEKVGDVIICKGPCLQSFHQSCLGLTHLPSAFMCDECTTGKHICFVCKETEGNVRKCLISTCGRFYHERCLLKYPLTSKIEGRGLTCPLHACHSCVADNPKQSRSSRARYIRCIRCPTAYHMGDSCIAAGSVTVSPTQMICANHFYPKKGKQYQTHVNVNWCFICSIGGSLICCESCPSAFHAECLDIKAPEGSYFCEDCEMRKHPRYGDIVWVKLGPYRWWPAEICHPTSVPLNIKKLEHDIGEFPSNFFGSHEYYWTHRGRVFLFQEGDKGSKEKAPYRQLAKVFLKAVEEANETNKPIGKVQIYTADLLSLNRCECDPKSSNPCGNETDCLNHMLMFECHPSVCPAGDLCQNQRFQKRQYVPAAPFRVEDRGWGLQALRDVKKGEFVIEYVGELIDEEECQKRLKQMHEENDTNFYFLTIDKDRIIDAGPKGNLSRFMNHSCQPNCETQKWTVNGDTRVGLFAICDIPAGSELTFNYNLECRGNEKTKCVCGAPNCSGFIGVRPKTAALILQEKRAKENVVKKKKRKSQVPKHEDECFRCREGGEILMCDRKGCPKAYHLNCLSLTKPPYGKWECPWHHCDECGKTSVMLCVECPNSFCKEHGTPDNILVVDGHFYCTDHKEDTKSEVNDSPAANLTDEENNPS
ncbi:LOW QUALITY PROTEIN: histone-lysine N-methyltransferase NSD2-like [Limulus polyphemus]|uniref:LOW QUALITY PROTEIN: histone-lysine N-methyltransferase NSD2-like n=1 Tax=Limulus polyphemus TaxID=6850 RepID=A0ABM1BLA6_LIMPO|nr:LOW QUALITY PROTEIN: histone-lysine N-methyltransferase NSD2-like [Limulus polyphemus]